jgi:Cas7 group CRISPR-associated protein Csh2
MTTKNTKTATTTMPVTPILTAPIRQFFATKADLEANPTLDFRSVVLVDDMDAVVDRYTHVVVHSSATMANPQGNLDAGNSPHQDPAGHGFITPQGITRKIRDFYTQMYGLPVHVRRSGILLQATVEAIQAQANAGQDMSALKALVAYEETQRKVANGEPVEGTATPKKKGKKSSKAESEDSEDAAIEEELSPEEAKIAEVERNGVVKAAKKAASDSMGRAEVELLTQACCREYIDTRMFGRLILAGANIPITGPCQFEISKSLHPVDVLDIAITCGAVSDHAEKSIKNTNIGRKTVVNFGLYQTTLCVSPVLAARTGLTWRDLNLMLGALVNIWEISKSSSKAGMEIEGGYMFVHDAPLPIMSLNKIRKLVTPTSQGNQDLPRRSMDDYTMPDLEAVRKGLLPGIHLLPIS